MGKTILNGKDYTFWLDDILFHHHVFCANAKRCVNLSAQNGYCFVFGILFSFTRARELEHAGGSRLGSVFIYILVGSIGMQMELDKIFDNFGVIMVGVVWMLFHIAFIFIVAKIIRAPSFFLAVGSKANIGGAASAPVVAAAFHPSLAPVGVLLAILGYAIGTAGGYLTGEMMRLIVGG